MVHCDLFVQINAMANRAAGKGYENVAHYENIDFHFIGIENIHVMRQSLQKMIESTCVRFISRGKIRDGNLYRRNVDPNFPYIAMAFSRKLH